VKLYWKVFLPLALALLLTMVFTGWFMGAVLPNHLRTRQALIADLFQRRIESLSEPTPEQVGFLADSMGVRIRLIPEDRMGRGEHREPPPLPGTVIIPARPGFPFTIVGMVPLPGARLSIAAVVLMLLLLVEGVVLHLVLRSVFRKIRDLERAASVLGSGDTSIRYAVSGGSDELDALGESFNGMAQRIDSLLASHKELMGSVAHELRTPLARLSLALELLREGSGTRDEMFSRMETDIAALNALVTELLEYNRLGRGVVPNIETVDILAIAEEVVASESWGREGIEVTVAGHALVRTDRELLARVLSNLVSNAFRHASSKVSVEIGSFSSSVSVTVCDDGPGFPQAILSAGFIPFMKGRDSQGVGLGLSIARRAASIAGGEVSAENLPGGGARVTLKIPV
jgi:signal transduction histidine kinase